MEQVVYTPGVLLEDSSWWRLQVPPSQGGCAGDGTQSGGSERLQLLPTS